MTFKIFEQIDASRGSHRLRVRVYLRVRLLGITVKIPITTWRPVGPFHRGASKRMSKNHCDMCEKYQGWRD